MKPKSEIKREKTCRICLCDAKVLKSLHDKFRDQEKSILEIINFVVNIDIQLNRDLPNKICAVCVAKLAIADFFKRRCLDSEEILGQYHPAYENEEFLEESLDEVPVTHYYEKEPKFPLQNLLNDLIKQKDNLAVYGNVTITKNKKSGTDLHTIEPDNIECEDDVTSSILVETEPLGDDTEFIDSNDAISADKPLIKPAQSSNGTAVNGRKSEEKRKEKTFLCYICGAELRNRNTLKGHRLRKHRKEVQIFECPICLKKFDFKYKVNNHMSIVHADEKDLHLCTFCGKWFTPSILPEHILRHKQIKAFQCDLCGKSFVTKQEVRIHIRRHMGAKPYPCNICGRRFITSSARTRHMITHSDAKPHACEYCPSRFKNPNHLKIHRRTHTGERPYQCTVCHAAFPQSGALSAHMRSKHAKDTHALHS